MGFPKKKFNFFEFAKGKYYPAKSDWKNKISRKVQNLVFSSEVYGFFERKTCFFPKIAKGRKLAAECDCNKKFCQSFENLGLIEKNMNFSKQNNMFYCNS